MLYLFYCITIILFFFFFFSGSFSFNFILTILVPALGPKIFTKDDEWTSLLSHYNTADKKVKRVGQQIILI